MLYNLNSQKASLWAVLLMVAAFTQSSLYANGIVQLPEDTTKLRYEVPKMTTNPYGSGAGSPLFMKTPSNLGSQVVYDTETGRYLFKQKLGDRYMGTPFSMTPEEYRDYAFKKALNQYWKEKLKSDASGKEQASLNKFLNPKLNVDVEGLDKIFGSNTIDIKPQGAAELIFGININRVNNPALPENVQNQVLFDFDEKIQMGVNGKIGDKMNLGFNYDTEAQFQFQNKTKLAYKGKEDEIIQSIEAGNVSLPLTGTLITGGHNLFGLKSDLKFGHLLVSSVFSQQKGESKVIQVEGGAQTSEYLVDAVDYEANRHFFLTHYFKDHYDEALSGLPVIRSTINITKIEVWVTNRTSDFDNSRNIVAFMDLAEGNSLDGKPNYFANTSIIGAISGAIPTNETNGLYSKVTGFGTAIREMSTINSTLDGLGFNFKGGQDFEKIENARKLRPSDFKLNTKLGYISLNRSLSSDEVLAVAFEYTYNGETYRVGEFSDSEVKAPQTLIVKLLKGTYLTPAFPTWDLMMKNIYSIGAWQVEQNEFIMNIKYRNDRTGTALNYLTEGTVKEKILLQVLNLDALNSQGDPSPDGRFDFVDGYTIDASKGRIIFPVREPFGNYLAQQFDNQLLAEKYAFYTLYDSTQSKAEQNTEKSKFYIEGSYRSSQGSEIMLGAANVQPGSVVVTSGGSKLTEGVDYIVDYMLGRVTILNSGLLESQKPIQVALEDNAMFSFGTTKTMVGSHFDYKFSDKFNLGGTVINMTEKPMTPKVNFGNEPISNTIWGFNTSYNTDAPWLTKAIDKLPFLETKTMSTVTFEGEFAHLIPGHSRAIQKEGVSYVDDFEGSRTTIDLKSWGAWIMASTPQGQSSQFIEGNRSNDLSYGFNRAKIAWYHINNDLYGGNNTPEHLLSDLDQLSDHLVRQVFEQDIFPEKSTPNHIKRAVPVLNLAFYPEEKGPYNFDLEGETGISEGVNSSGLLNAPETRWGGIMRRLQVNDFETSNIEFIEFWLMDPFVYDQGHSGGEMLIHLGNISEDVLRDSRKFFENGLPITHNVVDVDTTVWGRVPTKQDITGAFDSQNSTSRLFQDVGFDGLSNDDERSFFKTYVDSVRILMGTNSDAYKKAAQDPSSDDYHYFKGTDFDESSASILDRFKNYNSQDGNSPTNDMSDEDYSTLAYLNPDREDINQDKTLSESESYFQYAVSIRPQDMVVGKNYITDIVEDTRKRVNQETTTVKWYHFKIPVYQPDRAIGPIQDFKSIRFMRLLLTDFDEKVVMRFAQMDLVRGEWRKYIGDLSQPGEATTITTDSESLFDVSVVNIEENGQKSPVNYILPPEISREESIDNAYMNELNEQSLLLKVINLEDGDAKATYKNMNLDVRQYKRLEMEVHLEALVDDLLLENELSIFIRLGSDYKENYYEYEIPLTPTEPGFYSDKIDDDRLIVWPLENRLDLEFEALQEAKQLRNNLERDINSTVTFTRPFMVPHKGKNTIRIVGNPNLANIRTVMIGVRNASRDQNRLTDDGMPKSGEIWVNELRLTEFNEKGGWAANARVNARLADFGSVTLSGNTVRAGFGSIEKKVNERSKENLMQYDASGNFELGKFFPKDAGVRIPVYAGYSQEISNPLYNPKDPDIEMSAYLSNPELSNEYKQDLKDDARDYTMRKSLNLTNVKIESRSANKKNPLSISNFSTSLGYNEVFSRNVSTEFDIRKGYNGSFLYNYNNRPKPYEPFKRTKNKLLRRRSMRIVRDFNVYYLPKMLSFRNDMNKQFQAIQYRNIEQPDAIIPASFKKDFSWSRTYDVKYDLTKAMKFDFSANNAARVDEPDGWLSDKYEELDGWVKSEDDIFYEKRKEIWGEVIDGGRNTTYNHKINASWTLPINKIPMFNWVTVNTRYNGTYDWQAEKILPEEDSTVLGNVIKNTNSLQVNGQLNFRNLYNKVDYFKKLDRKMKQRKSGKTKKEFKEVSYQQTDVKLRANRKRTITHKLKTEEVKIVAKDAKGRKIVVETDIIDENTVKITANKDYKNVIINVVGKREKKPNPAVIVAEYGLNTLLSFKSLTLTYAQSGGTTLPGFLPQSQYLGNNYDYDVLAPGLPFVLGRQNKQYAWYASGKDWLTTDSLQSDPFTMLEKYNFNLRGSLEPLPGMRVDLSAKRTKSQNQSEYWVVSKDPGDLGEFKPKSTKVNGNFSASFNAFRTIFQDIGTDSKNYQTDSYDDFVDEELLLDVANRLANEREQYEREDSDPLTEYKNVVDPETEFPVGYGPLNQNVLLVSFLSAYSGKSVDQVGFSPFRLIPDLNWQVSYDGLSKVGFVKKYFKKINLSHGYRSSYSIGSFEAFDYEDGFNFVREKLDRDLTLILGNVSIEEQFSPLFNVDMTWANNLSSKFELKKSRNLSLSFTNNQLIEIHTQEVLFGTGFRVNQVPLRLNVGGQQQKFESDLNIRIDLSYREAITVTRRIEENQHDAIAGQQNITLKTTADYVLNERFNLRLFIDYSRNKPAVGQSFVTSNTKFGVSVRFTLIP